MAHDYWAISMKRVESDALRREAERRGVTVASILYALAHRATHGFTNFDAVPAREEMPRRVRIARRQLAESEGANG